MRRLGLSLSPGALAVVLGVASVQAQGGPGSSARPAPSGAARSKSPATVRAERRAYDGAPPVRPHERFTAACTECHGPKRVEVPGVGFSPPSPHGADLVKGALARCDQCHVGRLTEQIFEPSDFAGLRQDLRRGPRLYEGAPPRIPHLVWMRENCAACHDGEAAREEIRTSHPGRRRCQQCHLEVQVTGEFERAR